MPLDVNTRAHFEPLFGHDFSQIRIHEDGTASQSAVDLNALAYTVGPDIVFAPGQYSPSEERGRKLLAHELTHTIQQSAATPIHSSSAKSDGTPAIARGLSHAAPSVAKKEMQENAAARLFDQRVARIRKLLSYGVFDWAITDADATEVLHILQAMSPAERTTALQTIRLDRLIDNIPKNLKPELAKIVAESGGEMVVATQVTKILTYSFFDWLGHIGEEDASQAIGLLEALPVDGRDRALSAVPRDKRRRLHDALPQAGKVRLLQMWDEKEQRLMERQLEEMHKIEAGELLLLRVFLKNTNEALEAFAPQGVTIEVSPQGEVYYASLGVYVRIAGLTRMEAAERLAGKLSAAANTPVKVQLNPRPAGYKQDYFEPAPQPSTPSPAPAPVPKPDPLAERQEAFRSLILYEARRLQAERKQLQKEPRNEKALKDNAQEQEAFNRFVEWYEKNENSKALLKFKPGETLGDFRVKVIIGEVKESVARKEREKREDREAKKSSPEILEARGKKLDEFLRLAVNLRGESSRRFPYSIPVDSEGVDILVTGDPGRQTVLDQMAEELMGWSREHMMDDNYPTVDPKAILVYILKSGYDKALQAANLQPLEHEYIDRHELMADTVLASFGKTLVTGLVVVGAIGAAVGLGIITGGVALVFLGGLALYSGITSYMERRREIEEKGYDVPIMVTAVHAAGDAIGLSQLIEGITGERLGTGERLSSKARSNQLGAGLGSGALLLTGSRAFRAGQSLGQQLRLSGPGLVPETLEGVRLKDLDSQFGSAKAPVEPVRNPNPGPLEARARAALSERLQVGFDRWMQQMRSNPKRAVNVEEVLKNKTQEQIEQICTKPADAYFAQLAESQRVAAAKTRSAGDPLRPRLEHNEWKDGVTLHYEKTPPSPEEIAHAQEIQNQTGEPVHVFGDTPSGKTYPGIDGTIGEPPRALQLKNLADPAYLKVHAADAFEAASQHGYSKVEVHLRVKGSTIAEVKAAWEGKPAHPRGAQIGWETRLSMTRSRLTLSRLVIEASDGVWVVEAPLPSPNLPAVPIPAGQQDDKKPAAVKR